MKEQIYTIPVTEAFNNDCECTMCILEKKLEDESIEYVLGPFLMEPDGRMDTNENGFCQRHFELLYNKQSNRLGLGLIIDTHLVHHNEILKKKFSEATDNLQKDKNLSMLKNLSNKISSKQTGTEKSVDDLIKEISNLQNTCTICNKLNHTMDRYIDVILYLWTREEDFKNLFNSRKGFCLKHFRELLEGTRKYLNAKETADFVSTLMEMQFSNLERIQQEVNWFTKKFDYRYNDAPWGNSKDALPRSIQKLSGYCNLK